MKSSRKGMSAVEKIVTVIVVLTVLALILMFLFRENINSYLRQLPIFSTEEREINMAEDKSTLSSCPIKIGTIGKPEGGANYLVYDSNEHYIYLSGVKTNLYWRGSYREAIIYLDSNWGLDSTVAEVHDSYIVLAEEVYDLPENYFSKDIISVEQLNTIKGAYYGRGNLLCKT